MSGSADRAAVLGTDEQIDTAALEPVAVMGTTLHRHSDQRLFAMAFRTHVVDLGDRALPTTDDALLAVIVDWVEQVRAHDWSDLRGSALDDEDWVDLRTAMVRVGWGPRSAQAAWRRCRARPYDRALPTAAGWAGGGWVVPAVPEEPEPAFAAPVLESRGLLRWAYMTRWDEPAGLPAQAPPTALDPVDPGGPGPVAGTWSDVLSRFGADHYTDVAVEEAEQLAVEVLASVGLGPRNAVEAEDEPLPDRDVDAACSHPSPVVRAAAWFLLRSEAESWVACRYGECQHHWAVEAEEDAYEHAEVLELAAHGVANPVDAAMVRRRLLTDAFGDINDVPLAGASDPSDFIAFYREWVAGGRSQEMFDTAVAQLRGDDG